MELLYTDQRPLMNGPGQKSIRQCFLEQFSLADRVDIAVGYVSYASLTALDELLDSMPNVKFVRLVAGMYIYEGIPEKTYHLARKLDEKWREAGRGEILITTTFPYHGKNYCFYRNGEPFSYITGSANLSMLQPDAATRRLYEFATYVEDANYAAKMVQHIEQVASKCSTGISKAAKLKVIRERNTSLDNVALVKPIPSTDVDIYKNMEPVFEFTLPIKVPAETEKFMDDKKHYTKSNINVCYAAPRSKLKARDWFESQLTVAADIYRQEGYPSSGIPFFVATDDGYWFKAHTTSDNNKQFSAVGDELIMGRWLKGRLAAAGLVNPVNDVGTDSSRDGMITKEILEKYGCNSLTFRNTGTKSPDENGDLLDVWYLSFDAGEESQ